MARVPARCGHNFAYNARGWRHLARESVRPVGEHLARLPVTDCAAAYKGQSRNVSLPGSSPARSTLSGKGELLNQTGGYAGVHTVGFTVDSDDAARRNYATVTDSGTGHDGDACPDPNAITD